MAYFTFHHGGVSVPSLDEAIDWYGRVLGFEVEKRFWIEPARAHAAMIRKGPLRFEIFEVEGAAVLPEARRHPPSDLQTHGNKHVAFGVVDVEAFAAELRRRGADIVWVKHFEHGGANIFIRDNAGNLIEFLQAPLDPQLCASLGES